MKFLVFILILILPTLATTKQTGKTMLLDSGHKLSARSLGHVDEMNKYPVGKMMVLFMKVVLKRSKYDFGVPETGGFRPVKMQNDLFLLGLSSLDGTNYRSKHQDAKAIDIFGYVDGKTNYSEEVLTHIAVIAYHVAAKVGLEIEWGGLWDKPDRPHFEFVRLHGWQNYDDVIETLEFMLGDTYED